MYNVIKRNGNLCEFDLDKIKHAIMLAFDACDKQYHPDTIDFLTLKVTSDFENKIEDDNSTFIPIVLYLKGHIDKENPRVEIDVFEYNKEGVDKLVEMMYNVYREDNECVD